MTIEPRNRAIEVIIWAMLRFSVMPMVSMSLVMRERMSPKGVESKYFSGIRLVFSVISVRKRRDIFWLTVAMMKCWEKFITQLTP